MKPSHGVALSNSAMMTLPSPEDFGTLRLEGGNLGSDLSHVLHIPIVVYGNFS